MILIAFVLIALLVIVFIINRRRIIPHDEDLRTVDDIKRVRYLETHHRWVEFWILIGGVVLALLVVIDYLNYAYAWGNYSPIFHVEYDLPQSGETTLYIAIVYLGLAGFRIIHNLIYTFRVNRLLNERLKVIKRKEKKQNQ